MDERNRSTLEERGDICSLDIEMRLQEYNSLHASKTHTIPPRKDRPSEITQITFVAFNKSGFVFVDLLARFAKSVILTRDLPWVIKRPEKMN